MLSEGNSRNFHGYDLEDDLENIRLRGKPVWTDGIDEVYELRVSQDAYRVRPSCLIRNAIFFKFVICAV